MSSIIDLNNCVFCQHIKIPIIIISLIGPPISLIFLLNGLIRIINMNKKITMSRFLVLLIFISEIVNCLSHLLQLMKYAFEDNMNEITERNIICLIQIFLGVFSGYCTLLSTLLFSFKCYDAIKYNNYYFDESKSRKFICISVILISLIFSGGFCFLDFLLNKKNFSESYAVRDKCSYWCWLSHITSLVCFGCYWVILIINIFFAFKNFKYLNIKYTELITEYKNHVINERNSITTTVRYNSVSSQNNINRNDSLTYSKNELNVTENNNDKIKENNLEEILKILPIEERKQIKELKYMKNKFLVYPIVTIIIFLLLSIYRIFHDIILYDQGEQIDNCSSKNECEYNWDYSFTFLVFVETILIFHTFLGVFRGILYGLSFILFDEKIYNTCFYSICCPCLVLPKNKEEDNKLKCNKNEIENLNSEVEIKFTSDKLQISSGKFSSDFSNSRKISDEYKNSSSSSSEDNVAKNKEKDSSEFDSSEYFLENDEQKENENETKTEMVENKNKSKSDST